MSNESNRRYLPVLLWTSRIATCVISAAAVRAAVVACSRALRQTLGSTYATHITQIESVLAWLLSSLLLSEMSTNPAVLGLIAATVFAVSAATGFRQIAIVAACTAGSACTAAASEGRLSFLFSLMAGPISAFLGPVVEASTLQNEWILQLSASALFSLAALHVTLRSHAYKYMMTERYNTRFADSSPSGRILNGHFPRSMNPSPSLRRRSQLAKAAGLSAAHTPSHGRASTNRRTILSTSDFVLNRSRSVPSYLTYLTGILVIICSSAAVIPIVVYPAGQFLRHRLMRPPMPSGLEVISQRESISGLVSVIEHRERKFRFMTCDHSVLGGIYTLDEAFGESIFGQFHVHEAVRLTMEPGEMPGDRSGGLEGRSLCIGLGIGIVANALHTLGCDVDAVEIDPLIAEYARLYFQLRVPNIYIEDANVFLRRAAREVARGDRAPYRYVVHDVFSGGSVPSAPLFSEGTLRTIRAIMADDGVLAVNFVGVLPDAADGRRGGRSQSRWFCGVGLGHYEISCRMSPSIWVVWARLWVVFGHVRMFREEPEGGEGNGGASVTLQNVVFFASGSAERLSFRRPALRDFIESSIRAHVLEAFEGWEIDERSLGGPRNWSARDTSDSALAADKWVIANQHWRTMRDVFSETLWEAIAT